MNTEQVLLESLKRKELVAEAMDCHDTPVESDTVMYQDVPMRVWRIRDFMVDENDYVDFEELDT